MFVLGVMAGPRRELDVAQLLQLAPHRRLVERDGKFVMEPLNQIDQSPPGTISRAQRWMSSILNWVAAIDRAISMSEN
jgi:hypothetical protein